MRHGLLLALGGLIAVLVAAQADAAPLAARHHVRAGAAPSSGFAGTATGGGSAGFADDGEGEGSDGLEGGGGGSGGSGAFGSGAGAFGSGLSPAPASGPGGVRSHLDVAHVRLLQIELARLGFFRHVVTGWYGPVTTNAVKRFQRAAGLTADGIWGPRSAAALAHGLGR